jgi:hypothetical protein
MIEEKNHGIATGQVAKVFPDDLKYTAARPATGLSPQRPRYGNT